MQVHLEPRIHVSEKYFGQPPSRLLLDSNSVFRYCEFAEFSSEGLHIDGVFLACSFKRSDWYWAHFNCCIFINSRFEDCVFRGAAFSDVRFVEYSFLRCQFVKDSLDTGCRFDGTKFLDCTYQATSGILVS
jgi:fluoroquinolone resistance protein